MAYRHPHESNHLSSIKIGIYAQIVLFAIRIDTLKILVGAFADMETGTTGLTGVSWRYCNHLNSLLNSLVFKELSKLIKCP
jgi:hypothetical protein